MFKKILVPLDGSKVAESALPYAVTLAQRFWSELLLLRVVDNEATGATNEASAYLRGVQELVNRQKVMTVHLLLGRGQAVKEINQAIHEFGADSVIMGTHARTGLDSFANSSVAEQLLQRSNLPLLMIYGGHQNLELEPALQALPTNFLLGPVLVPLNGTPLAETALAPATELSQTFQTSLALVAVVPTQEEIALQTATLTYYPGNLDSQEMENKATAYLNTLKTNRFPHQEIITYIAHGAQSGEEVTRYARQIGAGVVVIAPPARTRLGRALVTSVAGEVLRKSGLPVLMVAGQTGQVEEISSAG